MASEVVEGATRAEQVKAFIMHHVADAPDWHIGPVTIGLPDFMSVHLLMAMIASVIVFLLFTKGYKKSSSVAPSGLTNALEALVLFIRDDICIAYLGKDDGRRMAPLFLTFFFLIVTMNIMGIIPIFATATANFNATLALAVMVFVTMTFGAIVKNGIGGFFKAFIPHGIPIPILVIIFAIEFLGIFIKSGVLALRLFANLLAGHIALFSILGLILTYGWFAAPAVFLGLFVYFLEILVSFLQAYIFTMLAAMFIGQVYHPEH